MKVYVVTAGEYSDYHIEKIFSDRESARIFSMLDADRNVEEYDMDDVGIDNAMKYVLIRCNFKYSHIDILEMTLCSKPEVPHVEDDWNLAFVFTLNLDNKRLYDSIMRYGKSSGMVRKIAAAKFAGYLYEHGTTKEEIIQTYEKKHTPPGYYPMYTTSIHTDAVGEYLTEFLNKHVAENIPLPSLPELQCMAEQKRKELEFKKYEG